MARTLIQADRQRQAAHLIGRAAVFFLIFQIRTYRLP